MVALFVGIFFKSTSNVLLTEIYGANEIRRCY